MPLYTFVDNAVPTSSQWNANLRDQVITQCTSGTRPASPVEGQHIYETDTDRVYYYSGSAWVIITEPRQTWTPTISQPSAVSGTVNRGWYRRENGIWQARLKWTASAAGTAGNAITVTTPVTMLDANDIGGTWSYDDSGTNSRAGVLYPNGTTSFLLRLDNTAAASYFGASVTIASTDVLFIYAEGTY